MKRRGIFLGIRLENSKIVQLIISLFIFFIILIPCEISNAEEQENYYTIQAKHSKDYNELVNLTNEYKATVLYSIEELGIIQVKTTETNIKKIGSSSLVDTFNPSLRTVSSRLNSEKPENNSSPNPGSLWDLQWDMKQVTNNGESYKLFSGTKNVTVGIIDSGLDINHLDLKDNVVRGSKNLVPKGGFRGKEIEETGELNLLTDKLGHGTHVAGQIAANGNLKGIAPGIGIKSYRVFGEQNADSLWIIKAIIEAAKDDVDVINISLGDYLINGIALLGENGSKTNLAEIKAYRDAIKFAENQGSIIVAAAGNDSLNVNDKQQMLNFLKNKIKNDGITLQGKVLDVPASLPSVVTVSSVGSSNELSLFSNYGKGFIDIAAQGGDTRLLEKYGEESWEKNEMYKKERIISTVPNQGYFYAYGNSMAAPKVSGALALIIDKNHLKNHPKRAIQFLYQNGVDRIGLNRDLFGNGILNVYKALNK
ncbi:S8 family serine peptidase [Bacillus sp. 8YEL33]|nr:S8 family serine peptidase [Bacillus sp. 8YEL33]